MKKLIITVMLGLILAMATTARANEGAWEGVDVSVIEKSAEEQGRSAVETPFNSLEGDMMLFVFLMGGAVGGFVAGYYYRVLTEKAPAQQEETTV